MVVAASPVTDQERSSLRFGKGFRVGGRGLFSHKSQSPTRGPRGGCTASAMQRQAWCLPRPSRHGAFLVMVLAVHPPLGALVGDCDLWKRSPRPPTRRLFPKRKEECEFLSHKLQSPTRARSVEYSASAMPRQTSSLLALVVESVLWGRNSHPSTRRPKRKEERS